MKRPRRKIRRCAQCGKMVGKKIRPEEGLLVQECPNCPEDRTWAIFLIWLWRQITSPF